MLLNWLKSSELAIIAMTASYVATKLLRNTVGHTIWCEAMHTVLYELYSV